MTTPKGAWSKFSRAVVMYYCRAGKFGGELKFGSLAVCLCNRQIKICQYFLLAYIHIVIPYRTTTANIFAMAILGPTAKFNSCQNFRLYSITLLVPGPLFINLATMIVPSFQFRVRFVHNSYLCLLSVVVLGGGGAYREVLLKKKY